VVRGADAQEQLYVVHQQGRLKGYQQQGRVSEMKEVTDKELYEMLDKLGVEYEVTEIFEGVRYVRVIVKEESDDALD
jgi:hypothetical protein